MQIFRPYPVPMNQKFLGEEWEMSICILATVPDVFVYPKILEY